MAVYDDRLYGDGVSMSTTSLGANDPEVGTRRRVGDEEYIFVYNAGGETINKGNGCVLSAVTGYSVTVSSLTSIDYLVGVCKHATIATAGYAWLMQRGFVAVEMGANNSAAAGGLVVLGTDGTFAEKTISTGNPDPAVGKFMAAIASGASGMAYINVR